ncbi:type II secretion system GspH family protein [Bacillus shivajii]|uniref:type II secretion system protein n=1 Tax=Bacillus shivajii TaxID=1983719 RepID=UPI001CFAC135|nr:type II secretion system protein [Bacillus shivajii]UCZ52097.1 type II secretion system GspH family protein [Bacillus shivajii]
MKKIERMRKALKNQKGLTLVELLAVIVILGIISAIAVPSIGGIINNAQKDAHIANAEQMANAARLMVTGGIVENEEISLDDLVGDGYIESFPDNPSGDSDYNGNLSRVYFSQDEETGNYQYYVRLVIADGGPEDVFVDGTDTHGHDNAVNISEIRERKRDLINNDL